MRFLYCTAAYPGFVREFYATRPSLELESHADQLARVDAHAFAWLGAWGSGLAPHGYEVSEIVVNAMPLQRTWAWENDRALLQADDPVAIAIAQAKQLRPDILLVDVHDERLVRGIREAVPSLRLVIGWIGGTVFEDATLWRAFDLVLSCAPESVAWMRERGYRAEHMHHGFNAAVLAQLGAPRKEKALGFFGQIVTRDAFHSARESFFEALVDAGLPLEIHSPSYEFGWKDDALAVARMLLWGTARALAGLGVAQERIAKRRWLGRAARWQAPPRLPVSRKLRPCLRPGVYGLDMFREIARTSLALNLHADASIAYASNMRLFETAGAGTCLLTDWRDNIPELFEPEKEIVTFRSTAECTEKIRWLLDHPEQSAAIGKAAQARALRQHTYAHRAERLHEIIRGALA